MITIISLTVQELTVALTLAGTLDFDPRTEKLKGANGEEFVLDNPYGDELPEVINKPYKRQYCFESWNYLISHQTLKFFGYTSIHFNKQDGFDPGEDTYQHPPVDGSGVAVDVDPNSTRLQLLTPFKK